MIKKIMKSMLIVGTLLAVVGCGRTVEVPTGYVAKVQTKTGFQESVRTASKFRLDKCWAYCDRLILLDVSDQFYSMPFSTFIPADDLILKYNIDMTMTVDPKKYDFVFGNVPFRATHDDQLGTIHQQDVYTRYAKPLLNTVVPSIMAKYSIEQVASNRAKVNAFLISELNAVLADTPFMLKTVGLTQVDYPEIITKAKEDAAKRRENENAVLAQRKLDLLTIKTREEVSKKERAIELYEAQTKSLVADKLMSSNMRFIEEQKTLRELAKSNNKVFVPTGMLDKIAVTTPAK